MSQNKFKSQSITIVWFLIFLNVLVFFLPKDFHYGIVGLFFIIALIQMGFSFLYLLTFIPRKLVYATKQIFCNKISDEDLIRNRTDSFPEIELEIVNEEKELVEENYEELKSESLHESSSIEILELNRHKNPFHHKLFIDTEDSVSEIFYDT